MNNKEIIKFDVSEYDIFTTFQFRIPNKCIKIYTREHY